MTEEILNEPIEKTKTDEKSPADSSIRSVLGSRNFRLLWFGEAISVLGDQFYMIALPWLVLQLTGDAFAVGTVLALAGIPRAIFMLVGGALTDRFSARTIMLLSNVVRMALVLLLTALVLTDAITLWMLYGLALAFGLADAFFFPAANAIVPQVVKKEQLAPANSLVQGTIQLSIFVGPILAGVLIALLGTSPDVVAGSEAAPGIVGIGVAFGFDALTFLASIITLWLMKVEISQQEVKKEDEAVLQAIKNGLSYVWNDITLRSIFIAAAGINVFINGPMMVGIPVVADKRLSGAADFGIIMAAMGGGMLIGTILAGVLPKLPPARLGTVLMLLVGLMGIGLALFGLVSTTLVAVGLMFAMGMINGYIMILFITWLQARTIPSMLGRVMSLLMFASVGLNPISNAVSGALIDLNMTGLFVGAGIMMTLVAVGSLIRPEVRKMGLEVNEAHPPITLAEAVRDTQELRAIGD